VCIDFYGRYQSQAIRVAGGGDRVGYVDPAGVTTIDADPISMLRGAPHPELAKRFIRFTLSVPGQALWQFRVDEELEDDLGPVHFELRRMIIRRSMYDTHFERFIDQVNPYEIATPAQHSDRHVRSFIAPLFAAMAMDIHGELIAAWNAIITHPAYPDTGSIVAAEDVTDSTLARMLELFDTMPTIEGPDDEQYPLQRTEHLGTVRAGWLRGGWTEAGLWPAEADPQDVMRRRFADFFRANYKAIVELREQHTQTTARSR
jgi:hypothetical protein